MNIFEQKFGQGEAKLKYLDADYAVLVPGTYVVCAVTAKKIPIENLRYWSVDLQEAYIDVDAAYQRFEQTKSTA